MDFFLFRRVKKEQAGLSWREQPQDYTVWEGVMKTITDDKLLPLLGSGLSAARSVF